MQTITTSAKQSISAKRIVVTTVYFDKGDNSDPSFMELFTEDFQFFFHQGGILRGKKI